MKLSAIGITPQKEKQFNGKGIFSVEDMVRYGYAGREDCAMFRDFKKILEDCAEHKCNMVWR